MNSTSTGTYEQIQNGTTKITDEYFTADDYNASEDAGSAYIAAKGHTFVAVEYNAENLDRASIEFDGPFNDQFMTVEYNGKEYKNETVYGAISENGYEWERYNSSNVLLIAGTNKYLRGYIDIETEASDLSDAFDLIFTLPNSDGTKSYFRYHVSGDDSAEDDKQEMSVDEAIYSFLDEEGQKYFTGHIDEFAVLTAAEINQEIVGRKWTVDKKEGDGISWSGKYEFEEGGSIKETIYDGSVGYFNQLSWILDGDNLVISGKSDKSCEVRKVKDGVFLLVLSGTPYAIMQK